MLPLNELDFEVMKPGIIPVLIARVRLGWITSKKNFDSLVITIPISSVSSVRCEIIQRRPKGSHHLCYA